MIDGCGITRVASHRTARVAPCSVRFPLDSVDMKRELRYIGQVGKPVILHIEAHNSLGE